MGPRCEWVFGQRDRERYGLGVIGNRWIGESLLGKGPADSPGAGGGGFVIAITAITDAMRQRTARNL